MPSRVQLNRGPDTSLANHLFRIAKHRPHVVLCMPLFIPLLALFVLSIPTPAESPRDIVAHSLKAGNDTAAIATQYTYQQRDVVKELDSSGRVKNTKTELHEILFLGGKRYERLIEKDDKPLSPAEARKEQAKIEKATQEASRLSPEERERRFTDFKRQRAKQRDSLQDIPDAYDFNLLAKPVLNGRPCYLIQAQPRPAFRGKNSNLLKRMGGKLWIDQADYEWVRVEADVLDDVSFGLFLAKLSKGGKFTLERLRVNNEVWLPKQLTAKVSARALVKGFHFEQVTTFSNYKKFSTDSRMVDSEESLK